MTQFFHHMTQQFSSNTCLQWLREQLPENPRIYAPGCSGEVLLLTQALQRSPEFASGVTFLGVWIPGINRTDYANLHKNAHSELIFLSPDFHESFAKKRACFRPLSYSQTYAWLKHTPLDAAFMQVSPPNAKGDCSLGVSADFTPAIMNRPEIIKIGHINPLMPTPINAPTIPMNMFDAIIEEPHPLLEYRAKPLHPVFPQIAAHIATLINDGETLQFGLGNVQLAVLQALHHKKNLHIHSGMISDPILSAIDHGMLSKEEHAITSGVALGEKKLYSEISRLKNIQFAPVSHTHNLQVLSAIENFTAINSVIEVDLFGQANAEFIRGQQISGTGGLVDFLRGAASSPRGKPIVALASTTQRGKISRIVPTLEHGAVSIARADMGLVVTEYGIAELRGKNIDDRASALIAIAHPDHRASLHQSWQKIRKDM